MRVILLQDIQGLGKRLDIKVVSDGYASNKLIPNGLVREATARALKQAEIDKKSMEAEKKIHEDLLVKNLSALEGKTIHISAKASDKGHLFAGIHTDEIVKRLKEELRVEVRPDFLKLPEHIKSIGEHTLEVEVGGKKAKFKLSIEAEK